LFPDTNNASTACSVLAAAMSQLHNALTKAQQCAIEVIRLSTSNETDCASGSVDAPHPGLQTPYASNSVTSIKCLLGCASSQRCLGQQAPYAHHRRRHERGSDHRLRVRHAACRARR
jgi:hypothetical protein